MFIYRAKRHYAPIEDEYATLDDAIGRAVADLEWGTAWPLDVVDETGTIVLSHEELHARADAITERLGESQRSREESAKLA